MTCHRFTFAGETLEARPSGALWWPEARLLAAADLHLGRSERIARLGGALLPPYDTAETLARLADEIGALGPRVVVCLGDSFDDIGAEAALEAGDALRIAAMAAGRRWVWIAGNHDPAPPALPGESLAEMHAAPLTFRHIAGDGARATGEVSGHYHPKATLEARGRRVTRRCFLVGGGRLILPAFGAYAGGLDARAPALSALVPEGVALLAGRRVTPAPIAALHRGARAVGDLA